MGRPRELTEAEKAELISKGFRPVEVWVPDWSSPDFEPKLEEIGQSIRESDERSHMDEVLEALIDDVWDDFK
jgi:hypothetical protein